ncbi:hypothetical protein [Hymenobacter sublimis]|uniref:DUF4468 domain-containing protein n=1 Tax=Hymenobacter sublimis TaxID=2933777 RepID=A0ABY4JD19_9BACT|nr:hypothetical protein [Hymenobacter sublimis]UPL50356.1 hypothetical protein MWH26_05470 [Hymenobacter sublimis]
MKHCLLFLLPLLSAAPVGVQAGTGAPVRTTAPIIRDKEVTADLRAAWLGAPLKRFRHLVPERRSVPSQITYYTRPDEALTIGGYAVTGISYGFYKGLLCCVEVRVLGSSNCQGIYSLLTRTYGPSQMAATSAQQWTNPQVRLLYTEMPKGYATVVVASTPLVAQYQAARQAVGNEAA